MVNARLFDIPPEMQNVEVLPPADVLDTLRTAPSAQTVVLDPWYNRGIGGERADYDDWLSEVVSAACNLAEHVFVWGFPEIVSRQIPLLPQTHQLAMWLTWYYKNCPSVVRGWRSAQYTCLHISAINATMYPEHFLSDGQLERLNSGKMRFIPGPPSVLEAPLNIGFVGKKEQTGHPAQKPLAVIEPLILMTTKKEDLVIDPMCGAGTTGEVCRMLERRALLCDHSAKWLDVTRERLGVVYGRRPPY